VEVDDSISISALQHVVYCARQAALIHVERIWIENRLTALGRALHERTDEPGRDNRRGARVERSVNVASAIHRIHGIADAIEWSKNSVGIITPKPLETKKGKAVAKLADKVQLCAQALCIEEMFQVPVPEGILFYAASHKRVLVPIDDALRSETIKAIEVMRQIVKQGAVPPPEFGKKCRDCSLESSCQPKVQKNQGSEYLESLFAL
jgi:CRISPR-associated exonuclease Cas4